jgi:hypothetical protein
LKALSNQYQIKKINKAILSVECRKPATMSPCVDMYVITYDIFTACLVAAFTGAGLVAAWAARDALSPRLHARRQTHEKTPELHPQVQAGIQAFRQPITGLHAVNAPDELGRGEHENQTRL